MVLCQDQWCNCTVGRWQVLLQNVPAQHSDAAGIHVLGSNSELAGAAREG